MTSTPDDRFKEITLIALNPNHNAAAVVRAFSQDTFGESNPLIAAAELERLCDEVTGGDTNRMEAMLLSQAVSLEVIFAALARRGSQQENMRHFESFMKLALRAQSQARATLEALAAIKNPPMVFAKQANIAHGHQQVNNGIPMSPFAEQIESKPNKLLEYGHGERLDARAAGTASGSDQTLAAVEVINRPQDHLRQECYPP
jgi:hypothetical protein